MADKLALGVDPVGEAVSVLAWEEPTPMAAACRARTAAEGLCAPAAVLSTPADGARVRDALDSSAGLEEALVERNMRGGGGSGLDGAAVGSCEVMVNG